MLECKPISIPITPSTKLSRFEGEPSKDATTYLQIVGALQYVTMTRSDIAFAVNRACQFMQTPTNLH